MHSVIIRTQGKKTRVILRHSLNNARAVAVRYWADNNVVIPTITGGTPAQNIAQYEAFVDVAFNGGVR